MYAATDAWVCIALYEALMAAKPTNPDVKIIPYSTTATEQVKNREKSSPRQKNHRHTNKAKKQVTDKQNQQS